jgi:hypothetical protein
MRWVVEYYEQADTTQPAEEFEVSLPQYLILTRHLNTGEITSILIR